MDLTYNMDVAQDSKRIMITSNKDAKELLFYVSEIGHFRAGQKFFTERSGKEEYYIIFTVSGRGVMMHKGKEISLEKNNAVLIYCHDYQYYATASSEPWEHYWVHFNGKGAKNYYNIINENTILSVHIKEAEGFLANMEGIMRNSGVNDIRQSVMSSMYITNMLTMMVMGKYSIDNVKILTQHQEILKRTISFIRENYAQPITLDDFTKIAHLSKYYFIKLFKQFTGMTPYEYLINYRTNQAKKLLRRTEEPISQVAFKAGFQDECNFIRTFRRITGTTPLDFRRMRY